MIASITSTTISLSLQFSSPVGGAAATSASSGAAPRVQDSDGDSDRVGNSNGHHRGGPVLQALTQALQALCLQAPTSTPAATTQAAGSSGTDGSSAGNSLETALRDFVQALFNAVKNANAGASASGANPGATDTTNTAAAGAGQVHGFAGRLSVGLSALITQVSNGNAPSGLQDAFNTLLSDLQANSSSSTGATAPPTLQSFLTALQQNLGYGSSPGSVNAASSVSAVA